MKVIKFALGFTCAAFIVCALITVAMIISQTVTDAIANDSASTLLRRAKFNQSVRIGGLPSDFEEVHRGFASVELIARFVGIEETPVPDRGRERWSNSAFYAELQRVFYPHEVR